MLSRELKKGIYSVGAIDWDRKLFDELIPLPDGTSYNSYFIQGSEKNALIDGVDPEKENELIENLKSLKPSSIDYIISHHAEQDHSGAIATIVKLHPEAKVVTNKKCKDFLIDLLLIPDDRFIVINEGDAISLGDKTLEFIITPWVHWPETMVTYLREDRILFSCDFFGSHLATTDLFVTNEPKVYYDAKRYYAEIMMPFRLQIKKHIEKLKNYQIDMIAPSHGPVYDRPSFIIDAYKDWISDTVKNEVLIPYVSMHGSTSVMIHYLIDALVKKGIAVIPFNLPHSDIGNIAMALVDAATIVLGSPTVLTGPHPAAMYAAFLTNALRPKTKFATVIGSYGWGGTMVEQIKGMLGNLKVELIEPVITKGYPKDEDFVSLEKLAEAIYNKHKEIGIL